MNRPAMTGPFGPDVSRALVVVAHPDDEVLGCGGTLARLAAAGTAVQAVIVADGETARADSGEADILARETAASRCAECLGILPPLFLHLADQRLDLMGSLALAQCLERACLSFQPDLVLTHTAADLNRDHRAVAEAAAVAFRPSVARCRLFLSFETPSSTEVGALHGFGPFVPQVFVDIAAFTAVKRAAAACYGSELPAPPHPRSLDALDALACWRGATCGLVAAEAFAVQFAVLR